MPLRHTILVAALLAPALLASSAVAQIEDPAPDVRDLKVTPRAFRALPTGNSIVTAGGARVTYSLDTGSNVEFHVQSLRSGRRVAGRCVPGKPTKKRRRCTIRTELPGSFVIIGIPGTNDLRFSGRLAGAALKPGDYRLTARATGLAPRTSAARFTIRR